MWRTEDVYSSISALNDHLIQKNIGNDSDMKKEKLYLYGNCYPQNSKLLPKSSNKFGPNISFLERVFRSFPLVKNDSIRLVLFWALNSHSMNQYAPTDFVLIVKDNCRVEPVEAAVHLSAKHYIHNVINSGVELLSLR